VTGQLAGLEPLARQWIEGVVAGSPVGRMLGVEFVALDVDLVRVRLPFDDRLTTVPDTVHGGVIATLIDITAQPRPRLVCPPPTARPVAPRRTCR
jgi:acyl-coenzyme A thioesterase PaaI-like protein